MKISNSFEMYDTYSNLETLNTTQLIYIVIQYHDINIIIHTKRAGLIVELFVSESDEISILNK